MTTNEALEEWRTRVKAIRTMVDGAQAKAHNKAAEFFKEVVEPIQLSDPSFPIPLP